MRVLVVIGSLDVGGTECHLSMVLPRLRNRGLDVDVLCIRHEGALAESVRAGGVPVHTLRVLGRPVDSLGWRTARALAAVWGCFRFFRRHRPDVAHFFLPEAYLVGGMCAVGAGLERRVMSRRSQNLYQLKHPIAARVERWLHARMTLIAGNSEAVLADLAHEGVPVSKLRLIRNGIDLAPFDHRRDRRATREDLGVPADGLMITMVANLIPYKGHADLLQALAWIRDRLPGDWRLVCVGRDDGIGASLRALADSLGIGARVVWAGQRADVPAILAASDLGVLASHEEGFSNAILEGMAASLPMVVTNVGGNAEAVVDGETGRVVPRMSPEVLGDAILAMATDQRRCEIGARGRARVESRFSLDSCVTAYEGLYREVLGGRIS